MNCTIKEKFTRKENTEKKIKHIQSELNGLILNFPPLCIHLKRADILKS